MAPSKQDDTSTSDDDLAQISETWTKLSQGEKTAQALETNLTSLEEKIDDLLASFEESERRRVEDASKAGSGSKQDDAANSEKESKS